MSQLTQDSTLSSEAIESDNEFFEKAGPLPVHWDDVRRFPRFYYRSRIQALIYPAKNDPNSSPVSTLVLTRDLSRGGINLLHTQQLFPGQKLEFALSDGVMRTAKVTWCRKVANRCYSAGARFVNSNDANADAAAAASEVVSEPATSEPVSSDGEQSDA